MSTKYTYSIINDFPNQKVDSTRLSSEVIAGDITIALDYINTSSDACDVWFKASLPGGDITTMSGVVSSHSGEPPDVIEPPVMADGRPIVRADTRPLGTQTYFTMTGDTVSGIGDGTCIKWDFSNSDYDYDFDNPTVENAPTVASGFKAKKINISFNEYVYLKDGTIYFQNADFESNVFMYITVPPGNYYPNAAGEIPASALGLPGDQMYAYATDDVFYACYVNHHHMMGDCNMGDELNAEGAQIEPVPIGWYVTCFVVCPEDNTTFRGFASLEMYRPHTIVLPGGALGGE